MIKARFAHTNIVAHDWKRIAAFYTDVFGCTPVPPERKHRGEWLSSLVGVRDATIDGLHLRLPGCGEDGPTLEVFSYGASPDVSPPSADRPGFTHIAFLVEDVPAARDAVLAHGGSQLGELVTRTVPGAGELTVVYMRDPEGNIVEVQSWA